MKTHHLSMIIHLVMAVLLTSCGSSAEATITASVLAPTPVVTQTPTQIPLPVDLTVTVKNEQGSRIAEASIVFPESGTEWPVLTDHKGNGIWKNLAVREGLLKVTAPTYLPIEQTISLQPGRNDVIIILKSDPYVLWPAWVCEPGETLLFLEDFQDGFTTLVHYEDGNSHVPLGPDPTEEDNIVLIHDSTTPKGDYSTSLTRDKDNWITFGDAVWRLRFKYSHEVQFAFEWNSAGPSKYDSFSLGGSAYMLQFTRDHHLKVHHGMWDLSGQLIRDRSSFAREVTSIKMEPNAWHYLEISTFEGNLQVWVDGKRILDVNDDLPLPPGGFSINKADAGILYFDNIVVCQLSEPFVTNYVP